jgi:hypothetical protein
MPNPYLRGSLLLCARGAQAAKDPRLVGLTQSGDEGNEKLGNDSI